MMKKYNTKCPDKIKLAFDTHMLKRNKKYYTYWEYHKHPNLLILGNTGSGKSYFLRTLVARIALHIPNAQAYICDFKNEFMEKPKDGKFYGYTDVLNGFNEFYALMETRLKGCKNREFRLLLIDEVVSWYNCSPHSCSSKSIKVILLDVIQKTTAYVRGHENDFVKMVQENTSLRQGQTLKSHTRKIAKNERRIAELDKLFSNLYEDICCKGRMSNSSNTAKAAGSSVAV